MTYWWIPFKAKENERKRKRKGGQYAVMCRICGKTIDNGGHICSSCKADIDLKSKLEIREL